MGKKTKNKKGGQGGTGSNRPSTNEADAASTSTKSEQAQAETATAQNPNSEPEQPTGEEKAQEKETSSNRESLGQGKSQSVWPSQGTDAAWSLADSLAKDLQNQSSGTRASQQSVSQLASKKSVQSQNSSGSTSSAVNKQNSRSSDIGQKSVAADWWAMMESNATAGTEQQELGLDGLAANIGHQQQMLNQLSWNLGGGAINSPDISPSAGQIPGLDGNSLSAAQWFVDQANWRTSWQIWAMAAATASHNASASHSANVSPNRSANASAKTSQWSALNPYGNIDMDLLNSVTAAMQQTNPPPPGLSVGNGIAEEQWQYEWLVWQQNLNQQAQMSLQAQAKAILSGGKTDGSGNESLAAQWWKLIWGAAEEWKSQSQSQANSWANSPSKVSLLLAQSSQTKESRDSTRSKASNTSAKSSINVLSSPKNKNSKLLLQQSNSSNAADNKDKDQDEQSPSAAILGSAKDGPKNRPGKQDSAKKSKNYKGENTTDGVSGNQSEDSMHSVENNDAGSKKKKNKSQQEKEQKRNSSSMFDNKIDFDSSKEGRSSTNSTEDNDGNLKKGQKADTSTSSSTNDTLESAVSLQSAISFPDQGAHSESLHSAHSGEHSDLSLRADSPSPQSKSNSSPRKRSDKNLLKRESSNLSDVSTISAKSKDSNQGHSPSSVSSSSPSSQKGGDSKNQFGMKKSDSQLMEGVSKLNTALNYLSAQLLEPFTTNQTKKSSQKEQAVALVIVTAFLVFAFFTFESMLASSFSSTPTKMQEGDAKSSTEDQQGASDSGQTVKIVGLMAWTLMVVYSVMHYSKSQMQQQQQQLQELQEEQQRLREKDERKQKEKEVLRKQQKEEQRKLKEEWRKKQKDKARAKEDKKRAKLKEAKEQQEAKESKNSSRSSSSKDSKVKSPRVTKKEFAEDKKNEQDGSSSSSSSSATGQVEARPSINKGDEEHKVPERTEGQKSRLQRYATRFEEELKQAWIVKQELEQKAKEEAEKKKLETHKSEPHLLTSQWTGLALKEADGRHSKSEPVWNQQALIEEAMKEQGLDTLISPQHSAANSIQNSPKEQAELTETFQKQNELERWRHWWQQKKWQKKRDKESSRQNSAVSSAQGSKQSTPKSKQGSKASSKANSPKASHSEDDLDKILNQFDDQMWEIKEEATELETEQSKKKMPQEKMSTANSISSDGTRKSLPAMSGTMQSTTSMAADGENDSPKLSKKQKRNTDIWTMRGGKQSKNQNSKDNIDKTSTWFENVDELIENISQDDDLDDDQIKRLKKDAKNTSTDSSNSGTADDNSEAEDDDHLDKMDSHSDATHSHDDHDEDHDLKKDQQTTTESSGLGESLVSADSSNDAGNNLNLMGGDSHSDDSGSDDGGLGGGLSMKKTGTVSAHKLLEEMEDDDHDEGHHRIEKAHTALEDPDETQVLSGKSSPSKKKRKRNKEWEFKSLDQDFKSKSGKKRENPKDKLHKLKSKSQSSSKRAKRNISESSNPDEHDSDISITDSEGEMEEGKLDSNLTSTQTDTSKFQSMESAGGDLARLENENVEENTWKILGIQWAHSAVAREAGSQSATSSQYDAKMSQASTSNMMTPNRLANQGSQWQEFAGQQLDTPGASDKKESVSRNLSSEFSESGIDKNQAIDPWIWEALQKAPSTLACLAQLAIDNLKKEETMHKWNSKDEFDEANAANLAKSWTGRSTNTQQSDPLNSNSATQPQWLVNGAGASAGMNQIGGVDISGIDAATSAMLLNQNQQLLSQLQQQQAQGLPLTIEQQALLQQLTMQQQTLLQQQQNAQQQWQLNQHLQTWSASSLQPPSNPYAVTTPLGTGSSPFWSPPNSGVGLISNPNASPITPGMDSFSSFMQQQQQLGYGATNPAMAVAAAQQAQQWQYGGQFGTQGQVQPNPMWNQTNGAMGSQLQQNQFGQTNPMQQQNMGGMNNMSGPQNMINDPRMNQYGNQQQQKVDHVFLNKKLAQTDSVISVFRIIDECFQSFDNVNMITALYRCAKLQSQGGGRGGKGGNMQISNMEVVEHPNFQKLLKLFHANMKEIPSRGLANAMWALAKLNISISQYEALLQKVSEQAIATIHTFKPQELSNTVWAFATLLEKGEQVSRPLKWAIEDTFQAVCHRATALVDFRPQELSNTAWAFAKILPNWSIYPMPDIYGNELGVISEQGFEDPSSPKDLEENKPPEQRTMEATRKQLIQSFLSVLSAECANKAQQCITTNLANVAWAFTRLYLPENEQRRVLEALSHASMRLYDWKPQEVANLLLAFGKLLSEAVSPGEMEMFFGHIINVCSVAQAGGGKGGNWNSWGQQGQWGQQMQQKCLLDNFRPPDFVAVSWTISKFIQVNNDIMKHNIEDDDDDDLNAMQNPYLMQQQKIVQGKKTFSKQFLNINVPQFFDKMYNIAKSNISQFKPQEISQFLWCYAVTGLSRNSNIFETSQAHILQNLKRTSPSTLNSILWSFITSGCREDTFYRNIYAEMVRHFQQQGQQQYGNQQQQNKLDTFRGPAREELVNIFELAKQYQVYVPLDIPEYAPLLAAAGYNVPNQGSDRLTSSQSSIANLQQGGQSASTGSANSGTVVNLGTTTGLPGGVSVSAQDVINASLGGNYDATGMLSLSTGSLVNGDAAVQSASSAGVGVDAAAMQQYMNSIGATGLDLGNSTSAQLNQTNNI